MTEESQKTHIRLSILAKSLTLSVQNTISSTGMRCKSLSNFSNANVAVDFHSSLCRCHNFA